MEAWMDGCIYQKELDTGLHYARGREERGANSTLKSVARLLLLLNSRPPYITSPVRIAPFTRRRMKSETAESQSTFATSFIWCHLSFVWRRRRRRLERQSDCRSR